MTLDIQLLLGFLHKRSNMKMRADGNCFAWIFFALFISCQLYTKAPITTHNVKLLVLIIASDDYPVYSELQNIWRSYMHNYPKQIESYFIKADPNVQSPYVLDRNTLWLQGNETIKPGIINKTIMSFEFFLPRIMTEFDYVLRTNLSSFYVFPRLLDTLKTCPKKKFYFGSACGTKVTEPRQKIIAVGSGSGFILSPDLVAVLVKHKNELINNETLHDDEIIGLFFNAHAIPLQRHARADFYNLQEWLCNKAKIANYVFQYRVKGPTWDIRLHDDVYMHKELLKQYYGIAMASK